MSSQLKRHGLSIGIERVDSTFFLTLKGVGKLTHDDYGVITPLIDAALASVDHPHINMYCDMRKLEGWEPRAAWDDLKLGLKHGREFEKIAIVGNKRWHEVSAKIGTWFIRGESRFFDDTDRALIWLNE